MKAARFFFMAFFMASLCFAVTDASSQTRYLPSVPGGQPEGAAGRSYSSRPSGQTSGPVSAPAPTEDSSNPVPGVVDVFKKAGGFFGR